MQVSDLTKIIEDLAQKRPLFHSEADFQHALAWEIHSQFPSWRIRLEVPIRTAKGSVYTDLLASTDDMEIAIELKYKTRQLTACVGGENYALASQAAQDLGRYDFCKDVARMEAFGSSGPNRRGFSIFLTNDSAYWKASGRPDSNHSQFAMSDGRRLEGHLEWGHRTGAGTMRGRESGINLCGPYDFCWRNYSVVCSGSYGAFRFLCVAAVPTTQPVDRSY